jgi:hypothetical protein
MDSCYLINNNINNEQEEMNKYLNYIENIKNLRSKDSLLPCDLHEQIPEDGYDVARCSIKMFFNNNLRFVNYGYSSGSIRIHSLYRGCNGIIYVVHTWCGSISDIYYFTKGELYKYFEGYENEMPDFKNPEEVEEYLDTIHTPPSVD